MAASMALFPPGLRDQNSSPRTLSVDKMRISCRCRNSAAPFCTGIATIIPPYPQELLMPFASGSISFRRFAVVGKKSDQPKSVDQELLDKLAEHVIKPAEFGLPDDSEYGWSGGRHLFDTQFDF